MQGPCREDAHLANEFAGFSLEDSMKPQAMQEHAFGRSRMHHSV